MIVAEFVSSVAVVSVLPVTYVSLKSDPLMSIEIFEPSFWFNTMLLPESVPPVVKVSVNDTVKSANPALPVISVLWVFELFVADTELVVPVENVSLKSNEDKSTVYCTPSFL